MICEIKIMTVWEGGIDKKTNDEQTKAAYKRNLFSVHLLFVVCNLWYMSMSFGAGNAMVVAVAAHDRLALLSDVWHRFPVGTWAAATTVVAVVVVVAVTDRAVVAHPPTRPRALSVLDWTGHRLLVSTVLGVDSQILQRQSVLLRTGTWAPRSR